MSRGLFQSSLRAPMIRSMWTTRLICTAAVVTLVSACATSHAMQQRFDDGSCPARSTALTPASQPYGEAPSAVMWSGPTETRDFA